MFHALIVLLAVAYFLSGVVLYLYFRRRSPRALADVGRSRYGLFVGPAVMSVSTALGLWVSHTHLVATGPGLLGTDSHTLITVTVVGCFAGFAITMGAASYVALTEWRDGT